MTSMSEITPVWRQADIPLAPRDVRFQGASGHFAGSVACLQLTQSGHDGRRYSMTSSARASTVVERVRPNILAALRLITSSNLVGCSTGRSLGRAPFRILST